MMDATAPVISGPLRQEICGLLERRFNQMKWASFRLSVLTTSALFASTALLSLPESALAACTAGPNVVCSGALTTQQVIAGDNTSVTTLSGFSVITTDPFPLSFPLYIAGNGAISYIDANTSTLSSTDLQGGGLTVISNGDSIIPAVAGSVTINTGGKITGGFYGINAANAFAGISTVVGGTGGTSVIATGDVTSLSSAANASAIHVLNSAQSTQDMTVQAGGVVTGGYFGIDAHNNGTGSATITATKNVTGTNFIGIYGINGVGSKNLTVISNGTVTGAFYGIAATNNGTGSTSISSTVSAISTGAIGYAIAASNTGAGSGVTVDAAAASGATGGISAYNFGGGATAVTTTGLIVATDAGGIGIDAENLGLGTTVTVGATGIVQGGKTGINAVNNGTGSTLITATKDVTGTNGSGVQANNGATALDLTIGTDGKVVGAAIGIGAVNNGKGSTKITTTGNVISGAGTAISAANGATAVDLTVEAGGTVAGNVFGIAALNSGTGTTKVTAAKKVTSTTSIAIAAINTANGTGITVDAVDASGSSSGIAVQNSGTGVASITARGTVEGGVSGIQATSSAGQAISIKINDMNALVRNTSANAASTAIQASGGPATIDNFGTVTGIVSLSTGADVFNNSGVWNMALGHAAFGAGTDSLNNLAAGSIVVAGLAGTDEYTIFDDLETFTNAGKLVLKDGGAGDTVEFSGNYVGSLGGIVQLDTVLGDDTSKTDRLVIDGSTFGTTQLAITNIGGAGARTTGDGIKVVEVDGPSSVGVFTTATLTAGAYDYNLVQGGLADPSDGNWYLRSDLSAGAQTVLPYGDALTEFSRLAIGTFQQRTGNRLTPSGSAGNAMDAEAGGLWARFSGQHSSLNPSTGSAYDSDTIFAQVGGEGMVYETASGQLLVGLSAVYGSQSVDVEVSNTSTGGSRSGRIDSKAYGVGANITWLGSDGLYVDGVGQYIWYDSDLSATGSGTLADGNHGDSYALSLEAGKRFALSNDWAWVPQAQLIYSSVGFDSFGSSMSVANGDSDGLLGRVGVRVERQSSVGERHFQAYGIANIDFELLGDRNVTINGESMAQDNPGAWGELGFGGSFAFSAKTSLYGEVRYATSLENFGDNNRVGGNVGLKVSW